MKTIGKTELIKQMAEKAECSEKVAKANLEAFMEAVLENMVEGNKITIPKFCAIEVKEASARMVRNPRNPEEKIPVEAHKRGHFKFAPGVKDMLNA